jgi:hypothetical protein
MSKKKFPTKTSTNVRITKNINWSQKQEIKRKEQEQMEGQLKTLIEHERKKNQRKTMRAHMVVNVIKFNEYWWKMTLKT